MTATTQQAWETFSLPLRSFLLRRAPTPADAEDILQDVFVRLHARVDDLHDESRLGSWIFSIARNALTDHYRARAREGRLSELPADSRGEPASSVEAGASPGTADGAGNDAETRIASGLGTMVDALDPKYREAIRLYELEGHTFEQVAARLGLSLSGAKSRVQRGRAMLRDALLDCCHFEFDRRGGIIHYEPRRRCCSARRRPD